MRKWMSLWLALALMLSLFPGKAEEAFACYYATVAVFSEAEGVPLRGKPGEGAEALALVYGGTPVEVRSIFTDPTDEAWALVHVGYVDVPDVNGYVPLEKLMPFNRNYGAPSLFRSAGSNQELRQEMDENARGVADYGRYALLADMGNGWLLAADEYDLRNAGFLREKTLRDFRMDAMAFMLPANGGDRVTVYRDQTLEAPIGYFYAGVMTDVTDCSPREGWAKVEGFGIHGGMSWDMNWDLQGYVSPADLLVFTQTWHVDYLTPTGILTQKAEREDYGFTLAAGSAVTVIGEMNGQIQIVSHDWSTGDDVALAVDPAIVEITDRPADKRGPARLGYACWPEGQGRRGKEWIPCGQAPNDENAGDFDGFLSEVLGEKDGWYQLRCFEWKNLWAAKEGAQFIANEDLIPARTDTKAAGAWTAEKGDQGLWSMEVAAGCEAKLTLTGPDGAVETYTAEQAEQAQSYAVYLTPGTEVKLEGEGKLIPLIGEGIPILVADDKRDIPEDEILFSGSGRYFCDTQIAINNLDTYSYYIVPADDSGESWFTVSDLFSEGARKRLVPPENGEWPDGDPMVWWEMQGCFVDLYPGQFLELHNCELRVFYGNG